MTSETLTTYLGAFKNQSIGIYAAGGGAPVTYQPGQWQLAGDAIVAEIGDVTTIHQLAHIERVVLGGTK